MHIFFILVFINSISVHALDTCHNLFESTQVLPINIAELYSHDSFIMGPAFREIFKFGPQNKVDYARAGEIWKATTQSISELEKNKIKRDLITKKIQGSRYYNNDFMWNIDLLILSLDHLALSQWISESETSARSYKMSWQLGLFIRSYDSKLAHNMALKAIQIYPQALKTRSALTFNSDLAGFTDIIPGKRSLMVLIKVLLGLPEKIESHAQNNEIKFSSIQHEISWFQRIIAQQLNLQEIIHPKQQLAVLKKLQQQIRQYLKTNPDLTGENLYLVVDGSFANGLALTDRSDIDLAIFNQGLRQYFAEQTQEITKTLYETMKSNGYKHSPLSVENIAHIHPEHFLSATSDMSFGFIGTIAFKVSINKIELIVYDYSKSIPQKVTFSTYEIIE